MAPTSRVILCRHSQAEHNVDLDYSIPDAPLTALGKKQSAALAPQIPRLQQEVELIISSALKRTLQSTKLGWGPAVERLGIKNVICLPQAQECNDFPCDTGSPRETLEALDEFKDFNLELLTPDWTSKKGVYAPDPVSLANRARWVRQYIRDRKEGVIVLVAHGDILRRITCTTDGPSTYQWRNAEVREYKFDPKTVDGEECFLIQEEDVAAAGGYEATSTEMDINEHILTESQPQPPAPLEKKEKKSVAFASEAAPAAAEQEEAQASTSALFEPALDSKEMAMLEPSDVAQDSSIFTAQHRIVFPRSDGDAAYGPANLVAPPVTDVEVNYFHLFKRTEQRWVSWSRTIATKLANDYFGLPGDKWELQDFPKDYYMTEQRKGPRRTYRTDPYLYGSQGHRFRSTPEFMPHAFWLLCDPTLNIKNCTCIYCSKNSRGGGGSGTSSRESLGKRVSKPTRPSRFETTTSQGPGFRAQRINYKIRAQAAPRGHQLPGVPPAVISCQQRNEDLAVVENKEKGSDCEGFRPGEFAYCRLKEPIVAEDRLGGHKIDTWPVLIEAATMEVQVASSSGAGNFDLQGRVQQKRVYDVVFLPSHEKARVDEARLIPGLMYRAPNELRKVDLGAVKDHPFLGTKTTPILNLENGQEPRPGFKQLLFCFFYAVESVNNLRLLYTTTDQFSRADAGKAPVKNVVFMNGADGESAVAAPQSMSGGNQISTDRLLQDSTSQGNRFLSSSTQNNYMSLDGDDNHSRRRGALRPRVSGGGSAATAGAASGAAASAGLVMPSVDDNTYWQGVLFGLERIWVGDLVRLRLSVEDVDLMIASLAKGNDLYNAEDRTKADTSSPYVLRIKAIYRTAKAEVEKSDDKIRVAGDVFRVVSLADARAAEEKSRSSNGSNKRGREESLEGGGNKSSNDKEGDEEVQRKRRATDERDGSNNVSTTVKREVVEVEDEDDQVERVLSSRKKAVRGEVEGSSNSNNAARRPKRPAFEIPFRPFLEKAYEDQLPMTPTLPDGYGFQRVNQSSVEVVCSLQQLAGRLWSSMATRSTTVVVGGQEGQDHDHHPKDLLSEATIKAEKKKSFYGHENAKDATRIILSLIGVLPGSVKAMEVHTNEGLFLNRNRAIAEASKLALESGIKVLQKGGGSGGGGVGGVGIAVQKGKEKDRRTTAYGYNDGGDEGNHEEQEQEEGEEVGDDNEGARSNDGDGRDLELERSFNIDITQHNNNNHRTGRKKQQSKEAGKTSLNSQAAAAAIMAASRALHGTSSNINATATSAAVVAASNGARVAPSSNDNVTNANVNVNVNDQAQMQASLPPLPPNWIVRQSRNGQGQYYANIKTKQTSWDRPTS